MTHATELFHRMWGLAASGAPYNKKDWKALQRFVEGPYPPAAHTSDGTPVYTTDNPPPPDPPPESTGKLVSEDVSSRLASLIEARAVELAKWGQMCAGPDANDMFNVLLAVLDERLGRSPGKDGK